MSAHSTIESLELAEALISTQNKLKVPGTATNVGFHCNHCGTKWTAYELTRRKVKLLGELDGDNI